MNLRIMLLAVPFAMLVSGCASNYAGGKYVGGTNAQGKRHGYGELFRVNGTLSYEGEWRDGLRHGVGKSYGCLMELFGSGCQHVYVSFEGEYRDNRPYQGINYDIRNDGSVYQSGLYRNGMLKRTAARPGPSLEDFMRELPNAIERARLSQ